MPQLTKEVANALDYFADEVIRRFDPASEEEIRQAERQLAQPFPPALREFLQVHNGLILIDHRVLSSNEIVEQTLSHQQFWPQKGWIAVARDGSGDIYVLSTNQVDERSEYPVVKVDHETGDIMVVVGSCYERFLWFLLDRLQRELEPAGASKNLWDASDDEEDDSEPYLPWPYEDEDWITQHDPQISRWRVV